MSVEAIRINDLQTTCDLLDQHYEETGRRIQTFTHERTELLIHFINNGLRGS